MQDARRSQANARRHQKRREPNRVPYLDARLSCVWKGIGYAGKGSEPAFSAVGEGAGGGQVKEEVEGCRDGDGGPDQVSPLWCSSASVRIGRRLEMSRETTHNVDRLVVGRKDGPQTSPVRSQEWPVPSRDPMIILLPWLELVEREQASVLTHPATWSGWTSVRLFGRV